MSELHQLIQDVDKARTRYVSCVYGLAFELSVFKPDTNAWSILDITEHLVYAEDVGVWGIWKALEAYQRGVPLWEGEHVNGGHSIEQVVGKTWKEKEIAPEVAAPRIGGVLSFWIAALEARQKILKSLAKQLEGHPLEEIIYPHPISGPLDARQRLQFLRFHIDRHREQAESIKRIYGS